MNQIEKKITQEHRIHQCIFFCLLQESKGRISFHVLLLQRITWFDDVLHQDLDDAGEASSGFVCLLLLVTTSVIRRVSTSQVGLVATNLLILQGGCEDSPANTNSQ